MNYQIVLKYYSIGLLVGTVYAAGLLILTSAEIRSMSQRISQLELRIKRTEQAVEYIAQNTILEQNENPQKPRSHLEITVTHPPKTYQPDKTQ